MCDVNARYFPVPACTLVYVHYRLYTLAIYGNERYRMYHVSVMLLLLSKREKQHRLFSQDRMTIEFNRINVIIIMAVHGHLNEISTVCWP